MTEAQIEHKLKVKMAQEALASLEDTGNTSAEALAMRERMRAIIESSL